MSEMEMRKSERGSEGAVLCVGAVMSDGAEHTAPKEESKPSRVYKVYVYVSEMLANMLPPQTKVDVHDLRKTGTAQFISLAFILTYLVTIIASTITGYNQLRNEAFLSPDVYAGECNEEPIAITNTFTADAKGYWDTEDGYKQTDSLYVLSMKGTLIASDEYPRVMKSFRSEVSYLADKATRRDMSFSMLSLATFYFQDDKTQMAFYSNADAVLAFGNKIESAAIGDLDGTCWPGDKPYDYWFDKATNSLAFYMYFGDSGDPCTQVSREDFNMRLMDINSYRTLRFDMRAVAVAIGINLGLVKLSSLKRVTNGGGNYNGDTFEFFTDDSSPENDYYDPLYENMDAIYCYNSAHPDAIPGYADFCLVHGEENNFFYPIISQYGNYDTGELCTCGENGNMFGDTLQYCALPDFLISLVYVPYKNQAFYSIFDVAIKFSVMMYDDPDNGDLEAVKIFHPAQVESIYYNSSAPFLDLCDGYCSLITFDLTFASTYPPINSKGTPMYMPYNQTLCAACQNGVLLESAYDQLVTKSPVPLIQGYYTCVPNVTTAVVRALGLASASASLYSGIVLTTCLFVVVYWHNRASDEKILNPAEKKQIVENDIKELKREQMRILEAIQDERLKVEELLAEHAAKLKEVQGN